MHHALNDNINIIRRSDIQCKTFNGPVENQITFEYCSDLQDNYNTEAR